MTSSNPYWVPILMPTPTSYFPGGAATPASVPPVGGAIVSGMVGANDARILFSGTLQMCRNEYIQLHPGNQLCLEVLGWAVQSRGLLRATAPTLTLATGVAGSSPGSNDRSVPEDSEHGTDTVGTQTPTAVASDREDTPHTLSLHSYQQRPPPSYRALESVTYTIQLEEGSVVPGEQLDATAEEWVPYVQDHGLQLQLVHMAEVRARVNLSRYYDHYYYATLTLPEAPGVYTLSLVYQRVGYGSVRSHTQVIVRPTRREEYEWMPWSAVPYYVSALSSVGATLAFVLYLSMLHLK